MDLDPEAQAVMEMMGKTFVSKDVRAADEQEAKEKTKEEQSKNWRLVKLMAENIHPETLNTNVADYFTLFHKSPFYPLRQSSTNTPISTRESTVAIL